MSAHQQMLYHVVFSTKQRRELLTENIASGIHSYMSGGLPGTRRLRAKREWLFGSRSSSRKNPS